MKRVLSFMVALIAIITLVGCSSDNRETFTVGLECAYPPFNWVETKKTATNYPIENLPSGYAEGYDVQISKRVAEALGRRLVIKMIDWDGLASALLAGEIDAIVAGMSPTEERKETIDFTAAYYTSNHVAVVKAGSSYVNATTLSDLAGAVGVGQSGTIYADLVDHMVSEYNCTKIANRKTAPLCVNNILNNEADFTIFEKPVALGYVANDPRLVMLFGNVDNIFDLSDEDRDVAIGIRKEDTELKSEINHILETIGTDTRETLMATAVENSPVGDE
ncbi:transporter substrate-binding domain-containing protein [Acholeplasma sp. OttesenSCG-928-E16]|nr:transporter substrate-binding domain-containing protein [Acholeplasma sp. OttesenSCG-928-E16]